MKKWKIFENVSCPKCGDDVEVLSEIPDSENLVLDDEKCKCISECGWEGHTIVEDGNAWASDGNIDSL